MHSHQRMTQYIRNRETDINNIIGGRDSQQKITEKQAEEAGMINFLRGGKTYGGETIINRIRMFTYRIGAGGGIALALVILLVIFIAVMRYNAGNFDFLSAPFKSTIKPTHKFEFF